MTADSTSTLATPSDGSSESTLGADWVEQDQLTRAQRALLTLTGDVARQLAEQHGVCVRPLAMRRIDLTSGRVDVVPVPCASRREDVCRPCARTSNAGCQGPGAPLHQAPEW